MFLLLCYDLRMLSMPNQQETSPSDIEGVFLETPAIALGLSDDDVARAIGDRITTSKAWWNQELDLEEVQKRAENIWLNMLSDDIDLYDYQEPYKENKIFTNIETLISQVLGRPPQPMVTEAFDTDASRELARNIEKVLLANYHALYTRAELEMVCRHLLAGYRYAAIKYRWDTSIGRKKKNGKRTGGLAIATVHPMKLIFDAAATDKDNIPLIAESQQAMIETLCYQFPKKSDYILIECGQQYGVSVPMTKLVEYWEVWWTGNKPDTGEEYEGVCWKLNNVVMDNMKNPNYNYDEFSEKTNPETGKTELVYNNFFEKPQKPYVVFNYLNLGKYIVDNTSLTEQSRFLQRQLEKRGRQIDQNADMSNAGTIYNSQMVDEFKVAKLIGDPGEKLMAKGDVTKAAMRLPINTLEEFVVEDKTDIRAAIDNLWGVNAPLLGEKSGNPTLGQDELSVQRNSSRLGTLSTAIENGVDRLYKGEVQLLKVFADEEYIVKYTGEEGKTEFIAFSNQSIESGIGMKVGEGTLLPDDPAAKQQEAQAFAQVFDPLTLTEYLSVDNPKETAKRIWLSKTNPNQYGEEYLGIQVQGNNDPDAVSHIQQISQGQQPTPPQSPSNDYVNQMNEFAKSPGFQQMNPVSQEMFRQHNQKVIENANQALGKKKQAPKQEEQQEETPQAQPKGALLAKFKQGVKKTLFS